MVTSNGDLQERLQRFGILSPIDPDASNRWRPAPRLDTLHGKVGGFLGNRKANANLLLHNVRELLDKNLELGDSVAVDKYVYSRPPPKTSSTNWPCAVTSW